ncbi:MAG: hypothetical protein AAB969_00230 [Patescibacteria group bacterium]
MAYNNALKGLKFGEGYKPSNSEVLRGGYALGASEGWLAGCKKNQDNCKEAEDVLNFARE